MKDFNLKEALAGAKVITVGGDEVTQLTLMNVDGVDNLVGVYKRQVLRWSTNGVSVIGCGHKKCTNLGDPIMIFDLSKYPVGFGL